MNRFHRRMHYVCIALLKPPGPQRYCMSQRRASAVTLCRVRSCTQHFHAAIHVPNGTRNEDTGRQVHCTNQSDQALAAWTKGERGHLHVFCNQYSSINQAICSPQKMCACLSGCDHNSWRGDDRLADAQIRASRHSQGTAAGGDANGHFQSEVNLRGSSFCSCALCRVADDGRRWLVSQLWVVRLCQAVGSIKAPSSGSSL